MQQLKLADLATMCGGELSVGSNSELLINQVVIDSRIAKDGCLFVAIQGENDDAHKYVASVVIQYATASLVNKDSGLNLPNIIYVADTVKALGRLASIYRDRFDIPVVAITGSNGKTTVKEMLRAICIRQFGIKHVLATSGNLNNHLGMPLTLLNLAKKHKIAIIEMGMNHSGELDYLSHLAKPTIAVVNNVRLAHAGFFNDLTDIANAKGEIYNGLIPNGIACVNLNEPLHKIWLDKLAKNPNLKIYLYGNPDGNCFLMQHSADGEFTMMTPHGAFSARLNLLGSHNQDNAVTVTALALNLGCSLENIARGLADYSGYKGRLERKVAFNDALIIDDSYNANPDSVKAAILAIKDLPKPHWFIFADLKELGKFAESSHNEIGAFASKNGIDLFLTIGELAKFSADNFVGEKLHFEHNQDIVEYCVKYLPKSATLLVKGSNSMRLDKVVDKLSK